MAELLECLICGYKTVRCGMTNHLKSKHLKEYNQYLQRFYSAAKDPRIEPPNKLTKVLGKVSHWSKDRTQKPIRPLEPNETWRSPDTFQAQYEQEFSGHGAEN